jgi:putative restriction endonuclease
MFGDADRRGRLAAFEWLTARRDELGDTLPRSLLERGFDLDGERIPLIAPQGIFRPRRFELPLSITTAPRGPYEDHADERTGRLMYAYRGTDPGHRDNVGLREAMRRRVPLIYLHGIVPGRYVAAYPVYIVADDPAALFFAVQVDDVMTAVEPAIEDRAADEAADARRSYITAVVRRRLHQQAFRERVISAYREQCALCRLRHRELLDAAHITPDSAADGEPVISNGLALCKLHHAAFDRHFLTVRPDYRVEVRPSILAEHDGPMLVVGLQHLHGQRIELPARSTSLPDPERLAARYALFRQAG